MSKHTIHGVTLSIAVRAFHLTEIAKGHCIGKVVNILRDMPKADFDAAIAKLRDDSIPTFALANLLNGLDDALAANYTKRTVDDFGPRVDLDIVEA